MSEAYAGTGPDDAWQRWRDQRPPRQTLHLDTAAAGRSSLGTLQAVAAHAAREAEVGAYVAEAEAQPVLDTGRAELARLLGVPPGGVAFAESGSAALACLLTVWPLQPGDTVAIVPSEWGPNLASFGHHGLRPVELATHPDGTVDLRALETVLATQPPAFVHLTQVASHRSLVQPVAEAAALCRTAGVPLWVDAAQALGHVDVACGADVLYAVSRKWLTGPRGVGVLAVASRWWDILQPRTSPLDVSDIPEDASPVRLMEPLEAHVAGRIGLCHAVREFLDAGPAKVWRRLAEAGAMTRDMLAGLPGWAVLPPGGPPSAITALRATAGQDIVKARTRLLTGYRIVTTAEIPARAPREMTEPLLRVSPHVDCTPEDLTRLRDALIAVS